MKTIKLALATLLLAGLGLVTVNAQNVAPAKGKKPTTVNPASQHLKKDGTPDMRYKDNKQAAAKTDAKPAAATTEAKPASTGTKSTKSSGSKTSTKKAAATTK